MNVQEFDTALSDLETRVDRLRALYENWFRGYEKMEPQVARKDVERRVYGLRKELPRNTALRFRYHQLYQRYTTLATYWQRTARQIEEGTYRLQLQRMKRRRGSEDPLRANLPPQRSANDDSTPPPAYELELDESLDVHNLFDELGLDQIAQAIDIPGPFSAPPPRASLPAAPPPRVSLPAAPRDALPVAGDLAQVAMRAATLPPETQAVLDVSLPSVTSARFARPSAAQEGLAAQAPRSPASASAAPAGSARPSLPNKPPPLKIPLPTSAGAGGMSLPMPSMSIRPGGAPIPGLPPLPERASVPSGANALGASVRPPIPGPRPTVAEPGSAPPSRGVAVQPGEATFAASGGLTEQRLRRLYDEYAAARRKNNEGDVRYETLASTIQKMLPDLSKKHHGKQIDFEIVLKDGRVGLKPRAT